MHETSFLVYTLKYAQRHTVPALSVKWQVPDRRINETYLDFAIHIQPARSPDWTPVRTYIVFT